MLKKEDIEVITINKPDKEESEKKIKALCEILGKLWENEETKQKETFTSYDA